MSARALLKAGQGLNPANDAHAAVRPDWQEFLKTTPPSQYDHATAIEAGTLALRRTQI